jgi:hypothetical protein
MTTRVPYLASLDTMVAEELIGRDGGYILVVKRGNPYVPCHHQVAEELIGSLTTTLYLQGDMVSLSSGGACGTFCRNGGYILVVKRGTPYVPCQH